MVFEREAEASGRPLSWAERKAQTRRRWLLPAQRFEWAFEWLNYGISKWAFVALLDQLARFSVLVAIILWVTNSDDRRRERHYQAWQVINSSQGKRGDGGRVAALEDLHASMVPLREVDLSKGNLSGLKLPNAELNFARFDSTTCLECNLEGADINLASFDHAWIQETSFKNAMGPQSNFRSLDGISIDFSGALLSASDFQHAGLRDSNLRAAFLWGADLVEANVAGADFRGADLRGARLGGLRNWRKIKSLKGANLANVEDAPEGFLAWATDTMGAVVAKTNEDWQRQAPSGRTPEEWKRLDELWSVFHAGSTGSYRGYWQRRNPYVRHHH